MTYNQENIAVGWKKADVIFLYCAGPQLDEKFLKLFWYFAFQLPERPLMG